MSNRAEQSNPPSEPSTGAQFIRADLHVHTFSDSEKNPAPDLPSYIAAALTNEIGVLAITDHNTVAFAREALKAAEKTPLVVLPGIEISTNDGHLLALFAGDAIDELEAFASTSNLNLTELPKGDKRSVRSMLDLVLEIGRRGGLAIPAHVDTSDGMAARLRPAELVELLTCSALAGLEFGKKESLEWFSDTDADANRAAAWKARQKVAELRERGLARVMSSDAHSAEVVGRDRASRTLTRLRLDDPNFAAIRNAIMLNPKARCKAEAVLPATYPRILSARFEGGFLGGVNISFSDNLNCIIGGRGSGKSTALLSIRAALGVQLGPEDEDPNDPDRMPDVTEVRFLDTAGSERLARRERDGAPTEPASGSPIRLRLADLGQDESGRLARGYKRNPLALLEFLDGFIVRHDFAERETDLLNRLDENADEMRRTGGARAQIKAFESEHAQLEASLTAATEGKVEQIAEWAGLLAAQAPFLQDLDELLPQASTALADEPLVDLDALASAYGVDLTRAPAKAFVEGAEGLKSRLAALEARRAEIAANAAAETAKAAKPARDLVEAWKENQTDLEKRLQKRQTELEAQGLRVQAGAIRAIATRLNAVKVTLRDLRTKEAAHAAARRARVDLVRQLHENRELLFRAREGTLKRITDAANSYSEDLLIRVYYERSGINADWAAWLTEKFGFRQPRVGRLAQQITSLDFAKALVGDRAALYELRDDDGDHFFVAGSLEAGWTLADRFTLETMLLEDRPRIEVQERGSPQPRAFDHLSAGQQRSVLLSLLLCAERNEPLVLDQPEDHLDGQYIAQAVVRHLEAAKEHRQILIATHSANLTVLGDAELVLPMTVIDGSGRPYAVGAVDKPQTRDAVCALLEGGVEAYRKRGERYGFRFAASP